MIHIERDNPTPAQAGVSFPANQGLIQCWTDGSSIEGCGGYAVLFDSGEILSGSGYLTNQAAELTAIELAISHVPDNSQMVIFSDSKFAIGCIARNFNLSKSPHLKEIQERIFKDIVSRHIKGEFRWIRGHSGNSQNRLVDGEARRKAEELRYE